MIDRLTPSGLIALAQTFEFAAGALADLYHRKDGHWFDEIAEEADRLLREDGGGDSEARAMADYFRLLRAHLNLVPASEKGQQPRLSVQDDEVSVVMRLHGS